MEERRDLSGRRIRGEWIKDMIDVEGFERASHMSGCEATCQKDISGTDTWRERRVIIV